MQNTDTEEIGRFVIGMPNHGNIDFYHTAEGGFNSFFPN